MTFHDSFLKEKLKFGIKPGLERIKLLLEHLGNPQEDYRVVHIAGTNGKGSVASMLDSIARAAGLRVGRYTSPHLFRYPERFHFDGSEIEPRLFDELLGEVEKVAREIEIETPSFGPATEFELLTAVAFLYFSRERAQLVILEAGLGGRLDATNVMKKPELTVITSISLDHADILGKDLVSIALEKAGILKKGVPLVTGAEGPALAVIAEEAKKYSCPLISPVAADFVAFEGGDQVIRYDRKDWSLALLGTYQWKNAPLAIEAARALKFSDRFIEEGLTNATWPGRLEPWNSPSGQRWLFDGAHNKAGIEELLFSLEVFFKEEKPLFLFGVLKDKEYLSMLDALAARGEVLYVPPESMRALSPRELSSIRPSIPAFSSIPEALSHSVARASGRLIVVCGSLYLVGGVREELGVLQK